MCALGMASELKDAGIAVNALWPKTGEFLSQVFSQQTRHTQKKNCRKQTGQDINSRRVLCESTNLMSTKLFHTECLQNYGIVPLDNRQLVSPVCTLHLVMGSFSVEANTTKKELHLCKGNKLF